MPTKPCMICGEQIQEVAKRCPHCHQMQSRLVQFSNTGWALLLLVVVVGAFFIYITKRESTRWLDHVDDVKVTEVKLKATKRQDKPEMSCIALLRNEGSHAWRELVIEATFLSGDGQVIDTATQRAREVVLREHGEARVRVLDQAAWEAAEYGTCQIQVKDAQPR
jgi:hypothetical protein